MARASADLRVALLRLLAHRDDSLAWATLIHLEKGLNASAFLDHVYQKARAGGSLAENLLANHAAGFPNAPGRTGTKAAQLLNWVIPWLTEHVQPEPSPEDGWAAWINTLSDTPPFITPTAELQKLLEDVEGLAEADLDLGRFLAQLYPLGRDLAQSSSEGVRIMTMTASKGLTVRATILAGLDNVVMPRSNEDQGEARRLLYVAMTRSKEYLYATWAQRRTGPTARSGRESFARRLPCPFFDAGPVGSQDGNAFLANRWPLAT